MKNYDFKEYSENMNKLIKLYEIGAIRQITVIAFAETDLICRIINKSVITTTPFECKKLGYLYISDFYFHESKRGKGHGKTCFKAIKKQCLENDLHEIQVEPIKETVDFWYKLGFKDIENPYNKNIQRLSLKF
jgi:GNAT superfamily N-acetyltransferase